MRALLPWDRRLPLRDGSCFGSQWNSLFSITGSVKNFFMSDFETLDLPESACFSEQNGWCRENSYNRYLFCSRCKPIIPSGTYFFFVSAGKCVVSCDIPVSYGCEGPNSFHKSLQFFLPQLYLLKCYIQNAFTSIFILR